jgi:hypothetical protein
MENGGIFYDNLEYVMAIWHNVWKLGIVCGHLVYFSLFGMFGPKKSGNRVVHTILLPRF